jgi:hypothetical protein
MTTKLTVQQHSFTHKQVKSLKRPQLVPSGSKTPLFHHLSSNQGNGAVILMALSNTSKLFTMKMYTILLLYGANS